MKKSILAAGSIPAVLILASTALSYSTGANPGSIGSLGVVANDVARNAPSCGACHMVDPNAGAATVAVTPAQRSLDASQSISVTTSVTGGATGTFGGLVSEATAGAFSAGSSTKISATGQFITHTFAFFGRSWSYNYTAPATPGLVELYTAVNTGNGDGQPSGDRWAFHGDPSVQTSVPTRLFVNAPGVTHRGDGCAGVNGNVPVLGSTQSPTIGNAAFGFELHGAAPSTSATLLLGMNPAFQQDLTAIGVTGCSLFVQPLIDVAAMTSAGNAMRGDGSASWTLGIANNPFFVGFSFEVQAIVLDPASARPVPVTLSNALTFTIR